MYLVLFCIKSIWTASKILGLMYWASTRLKPSSETQGFNYLMQTVTNL